MRRDTNGSAHDGTSGAAALDGGTSGAAALDGGTSGGAHDTLVVSGGGLKGVAALGAASVLRRRGLLRGVTTMVGTSAGALVCAVLACGRDPREIAGALGPTSFRPDINLRDLPRSFGLDTGSGLLSFIDGILGERVTFAQLHDRHGIKLVVCVTNVTRRCAEYLGPDTHPDMDVALALRMTCSVPLYFSAVHLGPDAVYVDGVITDNFPCEWALANGARRVLGVRFKSTSGPVPTLETYLAALADCTMRQPSARLPRVDVLQLDTGATAALNLNASRAHMRALYRAGSAQTKAWLKKNE